MNLPELIAAITPARPDSSSGRFRCTSVWRGESSATDGLFTSLDKLSGAAPHAKAHLEEHIVRNFLRYARPYLENPALEVWESLFLAEHHGAPTRLLNWSYSPLVAAHFATVNETMRSDRVVWELNWKLVHERFGFRPVTFSAYEVQDVVNSRGFASAWDLFGSPDSEQNNFVCVVDPPALDQRMMFQSAAFTINGHKHESLVQTLRKSGIEQALTRYVIPFTYSSYVRDQLDLCGFDNRRLFPDLDGVAAEIRRYYASG